MEEYISLGIMDPRLKHPFTCIIAGSSGCGKTQFVLNLVKNIESLIHPIPQKIIWFYSEWQDEYNKVNAEFNESIPKLCDIDKDTPKLMIIDDLMGKCDDILLQLFTKISHHRNLSVIYITQNLFNKSKENRTINLNASYLVLFKSPRDSSSIIHLSKQIYPGKNKILQEAFHDATSKSYGYLLIDLKPETPDLIRLRTNIFVETYQDVYVPRI